EALTNLSAYRQILTMPTEYLHQVDFDIHADLLRKDMSDDIVPALFSGEPDPEWDPRYWQDRPNYTWGVLHRDKLLYFTYWVPGGTLGSPDAAFNGRMGDEADSMITADNDQMYATVDGLISACSGLDPMAAVALFDIRDREGYARSNATFPGLHKYSYGLARIANARIVFGDIGAHEIGHAGLNWGDEYVDSEYENLHVAEVDILTSFYIWDRGPDVLLSLLGIYPYRMSEVFYANGKDNVSTVPNPGRVSALGGPPSEPLLHEGAWYGGGLFRHAQPSLMNNGWALNQSPPQTRQVNMAFGVGPGRVNDRLVNAGPPSGYWLHTGPELRLMFYDEDKNHLFHPTESYDVQLFWTEARWATCQMTGWPFWFYPCIQTQSKFVQKTVAATPNKVNLDNSDLWAFGVWVVDLVCGVSDTFVLGGTDMCTEEMSATGNSDTYLPYQDITVPTPTPHQNYYWRFRSDNGNFRSGWTNWSVVRRGK
ncbi:MAG: hypothetical protein JRC77_06225, partial [Deltaproteobacteria bacterium]|nr:hypothetical protein [Deltaproteobacteria bacterium]